MITVTYDYYKNEYAGTLDEDDFKKFSRRVYPLIDSFCFGRFEKATDDDFSELNLQRIKDCICEMTDRLNKLTDADGVTSIGVASSESVGPWSVSYETSSLPKSVLSSLRNSAYGYLVSTGLMCSWC